MNLSIRKLKKEDAKPLLRLLYRVVNPLADRAYPAEFIAGMRGVYTEAVLTRKITSRDGAVFGAFEKEKMVGFVIAGPMSQGLYYVEWVGVLPALRRKGLLGRLLRTVEVPAKRAKCHKIYLYTSAKNIPAARAYLKHGYRAEGLLRDHFLGGDFLIFGKTLSKRRFSKKYASRPEFPVRVVAG